MELPNSSKIMLIIAALFALVAIAIWFVFLRPVPIHKGEGTITGKTFKPSGTYYQYPVGHPRGFRTPNAIPIAESFVFEIEVSNWPEKARVALNTVASNEFNIGDEISFDYVRRGFLLWSRVYVLEIKKIQ